MGQEKPPAGIWATFRLKRTQTHLQAVVSCHFSGKKRRLKLTLLLNRRLTSGNARSVTDSGALSWKGGAAWRFRPRPAPDVIVMSFPAF
jgi:hypothetical protein